MVLTLLIPLRRLLKLEEIITRAAHRIDVQGDFGHRLDCRLRLRDGVLHRLVQRQSYEQFMFFHNRAADPFIIGPLCTSSRRLIGGPSGS